MRTRRARSRPPSPAPVRLVLPFEAWPEDDRKRWLAGLNAGDGLDDPDYAAGLKPQTIKNMAKGYGRWLAVRIAAGDLDQTISPADRVTRVRANAYYKALRAAGNSINTITARFMELRMALRLLQPETDAEFAWLTEALRDRLPPVVRRPIEVIETGILDEWGRQLMDDAAGLGTARLRSVQFRNGLLIAILAALAPRLRSLACLQLGKQVVCHGDGYRITLEAEDVKNGRWVEYDVPPHLVPYVRCYLADARDKLLAGRKHDWFWVNQNGGPLAEKGIQGVMRHASKARFGKSHGVHRSRHGLASTAARLLPGNPGVAAAILCISEAVLAEHYDKASTADAAAVFLDSLEEDRRETEALARRLFGR